MSRSLVGNLGKLSQRTRSYRRAGSRAILVSGRSFLVSMIVRVDSGLAVETMNSKTSKVIEGHTDRLIGAA